MLRVACCVLRVVRCAVRVRLCVCARGCVACCVLCVVCRVLCVVCCVFCVCCACCKYAVRATLASIMSGISFLVRDSRRCNPSILELFRSRHDNKDTIVGCSESLWCLESLWSEFWCRVFVCLCVCACKGSRPCSTLHARVRVCVFVGL